MPFALIEAGLDGLLGCAFAGRFSCRLRHHFSAENCHKQPVAIAYSCDQSHADGDTDRDCNAKSNDGSGPLSVLVHC